MLHPRRQGHAGFASVAEAEFSAHFPKVLRFLSASSGPLQIRRERRLWSLAECVPKRSINRSAACAASEPMFRSSGRLSDHCRACAPLRSSFRPPGQSFRFAALARCFNIWFRRASAVLRNFRRACAPHRFRDISVAALLVPARLVSRRRLRPAGPVSS
jgi:hypothetical protein